MTGKCYRTMQNCTVSETTGMPGINPHNRGIKGVARKTALPRKRRIPRKPSPAQVARFEALRARVMGMPGGEEATAAMDFEKRNKRR